MYVTPARLEVADTMTAATNLCSPLSEEIGASY